MGRKIPAAEVVLFKVIAPLSPRKEKAPTPREPVPAGRVPPRSRTCPAPTPRSPDAHPRVPLAPARPRGARAAGPRGRPPSPSSLCSSQPRPRHPHPASLSHPRRRPRFPTSLADSGPDLVQELSHRHALPPRPAPSEPLPPLIGPARGAQRGSWGQSRPLLARVAGAGLGEKTIPRLTPPSALPLPTPGRPPLG